jgi:hypothetical protein
MGSSTGTPSRVRRTAAPVCWATTRSFRLEREPARCRTPGCARGSAHTRPWDASVRARDHRLGPPGGRDGQTHGPGQLGSWSNQVMYSRVSPTTWTSRSRFVHQPGCRPNRRDRPRRQGGHRLTNQGVAQVAETELSGHRQIVGAHQGHLTTPRPWPCCLTGATTLCHQPQSDPVDLDAEHRAHVQELAIRDPEKVRGSSTSRRDLQRQRGLAHR